MKIIKCKLKNDQQVLGILKMPKEKVAIIKESLKFIIGKN